MSYLNIPPVSSFEIEFLAVGENSKSGDAILISWVDLTGRRYIVIIDGGYKANGEKLVELVHSRFGRSYVNLVVSTHPDGDHANGLLVVLEQLAVGCLLMHKPWEHVAGLDLYHGRFASKTLEARVQRSLDGVKVLAEAAYDKEIPVVEPFTGLTALDGIFQVLGPTADYYDELLPLFRCMPSVAASAGPLGQILHKAGGVATRLRESLDLETLTDSGTTSAENNSSAIVQFTFNGQRFVLTGDAGIPALDRAADHLDLLGANPNTLQLIQVPHHGSNENVGPAVLDRLLGHRVGADLLARFGIVSAAVDGESCGHPSRQVTNAFRRRGTPVFATQGIALRYAEGAPVPPGYGPASPLPFYSEVEE